MPKYRVVVKSSVALETTIEADSDEHASAIAEEMDGTDYEEVAGSTDWWVYSVDEVREPS